MSEHKFYVDGRHVSEQKAKEHWLDSKTYKLAKNKTRNEIWTIAKNGDENGNQNPDGEITHLAEAGIELR